MYYENQVLHPHGCRLFLHYPPGTKQSRRIDETGTK
ncbi:hypothetical protein ACGE0T_05325 [Parabacteroides sp. APC149_11_2_Y6]